MLEYKEKKKRLFYEGRELASFRASYPVFDEYNKISAFYEEMTEHALEWFCGTFYDGVLEDYKKISNIQERFSYKPFIYRADFFVGQNDGKLLSVKCDVRLFKKSGDELSHFCDAQCFELQSELMLPPSRALKKYCRRAPKWARSTAKRSSVFIDEGRVHVLSSDEWLVI